MKIKLGLAQLSCSVGDVEGNCARFEEYARRAAEAGCDVVLFPEMTDTGYDMAVIRDKASPWSGTPFHSARRAAMAAGIHLLCGLSERQGKDIFNSLAVFSPDGELLGRYRKSHLLNAAPVFEGRCFTAGGGLAAVAVNGMTWGLSICYDLRFPELYRALALEGAEILVNCSAWPLVRREHWDILSRARAVENQAWFVGINRVGADGDCRFCGLSRIVSPEGKVIAEADSEKEELLIGDIDREAIFRFRDRLPAMASRRPDLYGNPGAEAGRRF
ncbi:MAG: hypothetical protein GX751_00320 [Desulfuromonadaceae bacterium]|nr:hypothetical protein [Desulfuromonadaceae bacterium]